MNNWCPLFVPHHHPRHHELVNSVKPATVLFFPSSKPIFLFLVVIISMMDFTSGQLSAKCSHPKADYAWSSVAETVSLGPEAANGILLICRSGGLKSSIKGTKVESCVAEFDTSSFMVHLAPTGSSLESTCQKVLSNVMHLLETGKIQETKKLRFIIGFGNRIWYGNDYGTQMISNFEDHVDLNVKFDHPNIVQWAKKYLADKAIEALALVQTSSNTPSLPSILTVLDDPVFIRVLHYQPVASDTLSDESPITLGHVPYPVDAIHLSNVKYEDTKTVVVFFERYYALMSLNLKSDSNSGDNRKREKILLNVFPILPAQSLIGCPVHLCWWPVIDDLFYHKGVYYFFQGRWMWTFKEGAEHYYYSLPATHAIDLKITAGIDFPVYGAYFDYNLKKVMIVRSDRHGASGLHFIEELQIVVEPETGRALSVTHIRSNRVQLIAGSTETVHSATMIESDEDHALWVVFGKKGQKEKVLRSFKLSSPDNGQTLIYQKSSKKSNFLFPGISAFFYHSGFGHLFILTGYFLYIFQEPNFNNLETSLCSVLEFGYFFNCSGYFNADFMNGRAKGVVFDPKKRLQVFSTVEKFSKDAKRYHRGSQFLPAQCNFLSSLPDFGAIPFSAKVKTDDDAYGDGGVTSDGTNLFLVFGIAAVVVLGVAIFLVTCLLCTGARGRFRRQARLDSAAKHRLEQELKLKQYLKKQMSRSSPFGKSKTIKTGSYRGLGNRTPSSFSSGVSSSSRSQKSISKTKTTKLQSQTGRKSPLSPTKSKTKNKNKSPRKSPKNR